MVSGPPLVGVKVRLVLPGLMTAMPPVTMILVMVSESPLGLMSLVSGLTVVGTRYNAVFVSLTAVGDRRSKKLLVVVITPLVETKTI